jgi:UDP-3-O-[3-hydroxymyristoyl] glucosamine N-acyltransferase
VSGRARGQATLTGVATLEAAGPSDLSWVTDERRAAEAARSRAGALLVPREEMAAGKPCVLVERPQLALAGWLERFRPSPPRPGGVARGAFVHRTARLGPGVAVAAGATVEAGARVGARTVLSAGAFVGENASIGEDCLLYDM